MSQTVASINIKNRLLSGTKALGNSNTGLKEVCSSLVSDALNKGLTTQRICDITYLSPATIERLRTLKEAESGRDYRPMSDTCERILKAFGAEIQFNHVQIKPRFNNKPKVSDETP